ncbi:ABC transporter ATP-binding protein [bacterium]|nr:ABC transporter ATP-binding protein [bacterium]
MIEMLELTRCFEEQIAVDKVTLSVPKGEIIGYLGPNGAGKTTTVKMLTGLLEPSNGVARIAGFNIVTHPIEVKRRIGVVPESGALYQSLSPDEYLYFVGRLYHMAESVIDRRISEFFDFFQIEEHRYQRMNTFSKGMKQKIVITAALLHNPDVLFLDEPLNGLDANAALLLKRLIQNLAKEGKTIFYCSHILDVVENLCHRVVIIDKGKIVADGSVDELKTMTESPSLEAVFSDLTQSSDLDEVAMAFSRRLTAEDE